MASLNLCTDELLLALADPAQVATVTHLAQDPLEASFWREARRHPANDGSLLDAARTRPTLILTMGGAGRDQARLARALGAELVVLPFPTTLNDVAASVRRVGERLGRPRRAASLLRQMAALVRSSPARRWDSVVLSGGGHTASPDGLGASWLKLAGLTQRPIAGNRVTIETLLARPPERLVISSYRSQQRSREAEWLRQPALARIQARRILADGRRWTCMGPSLIPEVRRLRQETR